MMRNMKLRLLTLSTIIAATVAAFSIETDLVPPIDTILFDTVAQREAYLRELVDAGEISADSLEYNYMLYRINQSKIVDTPYSIVNHMFFYSLSNELDLDEESRTDALAESVYYYGELTNYVPAERDYLLYRIGVSYYKMGEMDKANKYISQAMMNGLDNSEAFYYKSLLSAYYVGDFDLALFYLDRVNENEVFVNLQDLLQYRATLLEELGETEQAKEMYEAALAVNEERFYLNYDLLPFYFGIEDTNSAISYAWNSFYYLYTLGDNGYYRKAYQQIADMKEYNRFPTYRKQFDFDESYELDQNLYFFTGSTMFIRRTLGKDLTLPVSESGTRNATTVYYTLYENYVDYGSDSGIFLVMGQGMIDTGMETVFDLGVPITKLAFYYPVIILLDPFNTYDSEVDTQYLECDYYLGTDMFDMNNDKSWDFLIWGYDTDDNIWLNIYYPLYSYLETYTFKPTTHDAEVVIQDIDNDGKYDILVFDDGIYQLN